VKIVPHFFQEMATQAVFDYFATKFGNPIVALPTGTGKSIVIADLLEKILRQYPRSRIICLTHVKELIVQNYGKLLNLWPNAPAGVNSAGLRQRDTVQPIIFAGIASVAKYASSFGHIDLLFVDEADLVSPSDETMYQKFINELKAVNEHLKVVGFTATPWRLGLGHLTEGGLFTDVCFDMTGMEAFNWLIHEGYLCQLIPKRTQTELDVSGVHLRGGEFIPSELQQAVDRDDITERACREAIEIGHDRKHWLAFCSGVDHAIHTADILNSLGINAVAIHSKMSQEDRDEGIRLWKSGYYQCAVNNNVLTTGIDFPGINLILMLRPTASSRLWVQMLGRGTRCVYAPGFNITDRDQRFEAIRLGGKINCLVLDYAGNTKRLGPINDPVLPRKKGEKGGDAPIRICDMCGTYNHASVRICIGCGYEFPIQTKLRQGASTDALIAGDLPVEEVFKVDHITYAIHTKVGSKPSIRVTYYCGLRVFNEFVCVEHDRYALRKAQAWWKKRYNTPIEMPNKAKEAIDFMDKMKVPTHLRVWVNKQYPEILGHCFDGTAFGRQEADAGLPQIEVRRPGTADKTTTPAPAGTDNYDDDDIPF
jgi:DNA repair protein RadD